MAEKHSTTDPEKMNVRKLFQNIIYICEVN